MENKTSRYFKYAIGEIILVVIGILIALQLNNWNDQYKMAQDEKILLKDMIKDLDQDIKDLKSTIERDSLFMVSNKILLSAFKNDSVLKDTAAFAKTTVSAYFFRIFKPTYTVFNSMQSTGKLSHISSALVRKKIQSYYELSKYTLDGDRLNLDIIADANKTSSGIYLDGNSISQAFLPEFARYEVDKLDLSVFSKPLDSPEVRELTNKFTAKQMLMYPIYRQHKTLLSRAVELKEDLNNYLKDK